MSMRKIEKLEVTYSDGKTESFEGIGSINKLTTPIEGGLPMKPSITYYIANLIPKAE